MSDLELEMDIDYHQHQNKSTKTKPLSDSIEMKNIMKNNNIIDDQVLEIMTEFPLLSSWKEHTHWTGFIQGETKMYRIAVSVPNFPLLVGSLLQGDKESVGIFSEFQTDIEKMLAASDGFLILEFLKEIRTIIRRFEENKVCQQTDNNLSMGTSNPDFFLAIFNELDLLGVENVESSSNDFRNLSLKYVDPFQRKHVINYNIPPKYPHDPVKIVVDLPSLSTDVEWPSTVSDSFERFKTEVGRYVIFWSIMDELDNQARVIEPVQPKRGDIHRRILLDHNVVVSLVFNPDNPKILPPEIKFTGPEKTIQELELLLDQNCKAWSEDKSILENLEDIIHRDFLLKNDSDNENDEDMESLCVICYAFEFEGNVPETTCECGSMYHDKCLSDLLVNDCSVKARRFCVDCPVCEMELKVTKAKKVTW